MKELPPSARVHFAQQHMNDASRLVSEIEQNNLKEGLENRRAYERFYNNLAIFSGGTIALSVTFLGYLKTLGRPISHEQFLFASWIALTACLILSFAFILFNLHYGHYFREREHAEALQKKLRPR